MQEMTVGSWTDYKTLVSSKSLLMQYSVGVNSYEVFSPEAAVFLWHITLNSGTADYIDFENNFKSAANAPLTLGGGTFSAHIIGEAQIFTNEAIRGTSAVNSFSGENSGFRVKTIIVSNGLNQDVSIQCQGSRDGSTWFAVGTPWSVATTITTFQTCETYFPFLRAVATCAVAPTTGTLNLWLERMGS